MNIDRPVCSGITCEFHLYDLGGYTYWSAQSTQWPRDVLPFIRLVRPGCTEYAETWVLPNPHGNVMAAIGTIAVNKALRNATFAYAPIAKAIETFGWEVLIETLAIGGGEAVQALVASTP